MKMARLAIPLIVSRLGDMFASFLFLAFVGNYLPDFMGKVSFAWAFTSFVTVLGIGLFSTVLIDGAAVKDADVEQLANLLSSGLQLALICGFTIVVMVLSYAIIISGSIQQSSSGLLVLLTMSLVIPAVYCQMVVFNLCNAQGKTGYELICLWSINTVFVIASLVCLYYRPVVNVFYFVFAYVILRWLGVGVVVFIAVRLVLSGCRLWRFNKRSFCEQIRLFSTGAPLALCFGAESFLYFAFSLVSKDLGDVELAAYQVSMHFLSVIYMISIGVGNAAGILISGDHKENRIILSRSRLLEGLMLGGSLMVPCLLVCLFFSGYIASLYTSDQRVAAIAAGAIQLATPFLVFELVYVVTRMVLRSLGDSWFPTVLTLVCLNGVGLLFTWLLFCFYQSSVKSIVFALIGCTFVLMASLLARLIDFTDPRRQYQVAR